ncbi:MAG: hypothetical protein ACREJ2_11220 [Planctomycetota bacterium]
MAQSRSLHRRPYRASRAWIAGLLPAVAITLLLSPVPTLSPLSNLAIGALVAAEDAPTLIQDIHDGADGVTIASHVTAIVPDGDFVFVGIEYTGTIKCFKRDPATGKLRFVADTVWGVKNDSLQLCLAGKTLVGVGGAGHRTGDQDSRDLHSWTVDPKTGALTEKSKLDLPISYGIVAAPDGKCVYVLYKKKATVARFTVAVDGTLAPASTMAFKGVTSEMDSLTLSPDGRNLYALCTDKQGMVLRQLNLGGDGDFASDTAPAISQSLADLTADVHFPLTKWGWDWGHGIFLSPDGKQLYAHFYPYGDTEDVRFAEYNRDPKTGTVTFVKRLDEKTTPAMVRLSAVFEPDGTRGYFVSGSESSGNVAGWFTRDPKTGDLALGGIVKQTQHSGPCCLALDAKNHVLYVGAWSNQHLYVLKTP